uniref:Uncharacterized protein n=1 Tax=Anopheles merus TaxID=30066 RepID=A0A182V5K2_ANOME
MSVDADGCPRRGPVSGRFGGEFLIGSVPPTRGREAIARDRERKQKQRGTALTIRFSTWSGTLRELLQMAWAEECEKMTGAFEVASASSIVGTETCDRSTIMPSRFISVTTSVPKCERPPMWGTRPGSSTLQQSAHGVLQVCVRVR